MRIGEFVVALLPIDATEATYIQPQACLSLIPNSLA